MCISELKDRSDNNGSRCNKLIFLFSVPMGPGPESQYLPPDMMPPSSSPEPLMPEDQYGMPQLPPRSLAGPYSSLPPNHPDVPSETW